MLLFLRKCLLLAACFALVSACTPAFDWRKVGDAAGTYSATFPAKPVEATREFVIAGETLNLTLHSATAQGAFFAVGTLPLTAEQQAKAPEILKALQAAMTNNIAATQSKEQQVVIAGRQWTQVRAEGSLGKGKPAVMLGRFVVLPGKVLEVIALGEQGVMSEEVMDAWFSGFKLERDAP
ncbi:MAG: hypothetical protein LW629_01660 [Burkholderiales bacterium]|nr:hypothetical protein [Burkholderiales bacterium]